MFTTQIEFLPNCTRLSFIAKSIRARGQIVQVLQIAAMAICSVPVLAQDWPQILGPDRNGQATGHTNLSATWPEEPKLAWQIGLGSGFGGAAIVGERALVMHRLGKDEVLEAVELSTGKNIWRAAWPASYEASYNPDNGPRCVPTVADNKAICYGAAGDLTCVDIRSGKLLWQRSLRKEYDADDGYFGAGSSPLVVGNLAIICLGGQAAGIVAVEIDSGKTRWASTDYDASYASPINVNQSTALVVTRLRTVLISVSDGKVLGEIAFGSRGPTVNAATPIQVAPNRFFLTASYGVGATLLSTENRTLSAIFDGSQLLSSQYNTPVAIAGNVNGVAGRVIGIDGREDVGVASLRAVDLEKQEIIWEEPSFGVAHLIAIGPQVLALKLEGELVLIDSRADHFQQLATTALPPGSYRAPPALSGDKLIVRSTNQASGRSQLSCILLPLE